jgi:hypothetical protein
VVPEMSVENNTPQTKIDLKTCIDNVLKVANDELKLESISIPALYYDEKGGFYANTMIDGVLDFLAE